MKVNVIAYRCGQTNNKLNGDNDVPLNHNGVLQAHILGGEISENTDVVFTSSMVRAIQTAQYALNGKQYIPLVLLDGVKEVGLKESNSDAVERFKNALNNGLLDFSNAKKVIIFTHGAILAALSKDSNMDDIKIRNAQKVSFEYDTENSTISNFRTHNS